MHLGLPMPVIAGCSLLLNDQLLNREHCRSSFVLPAAHWSMHASRTRCSFLRPRSARVELFESCRRLSRSWRGRGDSPLNNQRRSFAPARAPEQHSNANKSERSRDALQPLPPHETWTTLVAEPPAGPNTPTQAHDLVATFGTEVGTITREERHVCEAFPRAM